MYINVILILLWVLAVYFILANLLFIIQVAYSYRLVRSEKKRPKELPDGFLQSRLPKVSVLIPCYNESKIIAANAEAILKNSYPDLEVIVINDGSTDRTFEVLDEAFALELQAEHVDFKVYRSKKNSRLLVLDQDNHGKAQSMNHALQICSGALVATIDADTSIIDDAFLKCVHYLGEHPDCMVLGGIVRVLNGAKIVDGKVLHGDLPRRFLPLFQTIEYIRSFFGGRLGWEAIGGSALVPGAFSLFRKEALVAVKGFDSQSATEDFEIVIRMKQEFSRLNKPCEIHMISWPVCWTEVPEHFRELYHQRARWQRGLLQTLWKHRGLVGNPKAGRTGMLTLPYMVVFEGVSPFVELLGYVVVTLAYLENLISAENLRYFLALGFTFYSLLTLVTVHLEERYYSKHVKGKSALIFFLYSFLENFGYRQFIFLARLRGSIEAFSPGNFWGLHKRGDEEQKMRLNQTENLAQILIVAVVFAGTVLFLKNRPSGPTELSGLQSLIAQRDSELRLGNYEGALTHAEDIYRLSAQNAANLPDIARLRSKTGRYEAAAAAWEDYLKTSSSYEEACPQLGRDYLAAGLNEKALTAFELCYSKLADNTDVIYFLAREYEHRKDFKRAGDLYSKGMELSKTYVDLAVGLARVTYYRGDRTSALAIVQKALKSDPAHSEALALQKSIQQGRP